MIGVILAVSAVLVGMVLFLHLWKGIPIGRLTRDPAAISGSPFYVGLLSQIGIFLWSAAAAICLFSANGLSHTGNLKVKPFLIVSGLMTLVLGLDDAFLIHEEVMPHFFGVPPEAVFVSYALLILLFLVVFNSVILKTEYVLLVMALICFGASVASDVFESPGYLFEDGAKLVGIVSWLAYFFRTGTAALVHNVAQQAAAPDG